MMPSIHDRRYDGRPASRARLPRRQSQPAPALPDGTPRPDAPSLREEEAVQRAADVDHAATLTVEALRVLFEQWQEGAAEGARRERMASVPFLAVIICLCSSVIDLTWIIMARWVSLLAPVREQTALVLWVFVAEWLLMVLIAAGLMARMAHGRWRKRGQDGNPRAAP